MGDLNGLCSSVLLSTGSASKTEEGNVDEPVAFHPSGPPTYRSSQLSENGSPFTPGPIGLSLPDRPAYSLPDRLAYSLGTDGPPHCRTDWTIHYRTDWPIHYRTDWPLHSGPTASLKQFLVSKSETENCFSEGSEPGPFWEFYIGITIKRCLQRRRCTERH